MNWKAFWTWVAGALAGPITVLAPYITEWNWKLPSEAKGAILLSLLGGLGLVNIKRPQDHQP